jgi:hypothetical protein
MLFVFQSSQGLNTGQNFWEGAGLVNGEMPGTVNDFGLSLNASGQILAGVGNPDRSVHSGSGFNNGQPHVVTFKRTRSSGTALLYVDGTLVSGMAGGTQSLTSPNRLVLGAQQTLDNFFNGDIAEVQIYDAVLPDPDRLGLENSLKCKYGIAGGMVPLAPTGLAGAAGNRKISLTWTLTPGATDYTLWRSTDNGVSFQTVANGLTAGSYVDANAVSGRTNYYRVAGTDACGDGTGSGMLGVFLPLPSLDLNLSAGSLALNWPGWANDWQLCSATNLTPPVRWLPVTSGITSNDGMFSVTLPAGTGQTFFRLASPAN